MTDILDELTWRGLLALSTDPDELRAALDSSRVTFYGGFDPTAPGLHIGNLVLLLTMRRLQLAGHQPIGLVGGATGLIGDPSGKSAERLLNPRETVAAWVERIRGEVARFLEFGPGPSGALLVSNLEWTEQLSALDFLRDIGKHFPVNRMLARESVKARLEAGGISYTEFSYQICRPTTTWNCTGGTAARSSLAAATSGGTWWPGWTSSSGSRRCRCTRWPPR